MELLSFKNYTIHITETDNGKGYWKYIEYKIWDRKNKLLFNKTRNYSTSNHCFFEKDGKDYMLFSENYHGGQSIFCFQTLEYNNYVPIEKQKEHFCWASIYPNPDSNIVAVHGCYWGDPFDINFYKMKDDPMELPYEYFHSIENVWDVDTDESIPNAWYDDEIEFTRNYSCAYEDGKIHGPFTDILKKVGSKLLRSKNEKELLCQWNKYKKEYSEWL